ncbi:uncharacterized protein [Apostichopus japonicus]|uniref:uncharacterized protein isoform X3 n=1 Tax=Stichopus japonicus TaxID=307972 RepID=UPI003AB88B1B
MDLKVAYIILLFSFIEPSFVDTLDCNKMCSSVSNNELSCYVQSTGCDVVFPTRVFSMADPFYYWTFMNFTKNLRGSSSNISFELRGTFWYRDEYLFQRYTFRIDYIKRDNVGNIVSAELAFVIRNTVAQDSGVYDVVLKEGSYKQARTAVLHQTYRLFNTHSPSPTPVCSAVDTASLPLDVNADYLLNCTVLGYFYPKIEVKIVSSSGECPYQIVNKTKASLLPEMTLEHAYVTYCENTSFTCVVSQNRFTYDNEVYSCAFQLERPKNGSDAELAIENVVAGIIVSNHGGRQLDGVLVTIDALPEVVEAVKGSDVEIHLDCGVRKGTDVLKALALGARAVFIGRPVLWELAYKGEEGVKMVLEILKNEFSTAMALSD